VEAADIAAAMIRQAIRQALPRRATTPNPTIKASGGIVDMTTISTVFCREVSHQGNMSPIVATAMIGQAIRQFMSRRGTTPSPTIAARGTIVERMTIATGKSGELNLKNQGKLSTMKPEGMKVGMSEKCSR